MKDNQNSGDLRPTVLVSGAAGGLGVHIVGALAEAGWEVRAWDKATPTQRGRHALAEYAEDVRWYQRGDSEQELRDLVQGCSAVVHAAGLVTLSATEQELFRDNCDLSTRLYKTAIDAGVEHFVHLSCVFVYDADGSVQTEDATTAAYNLFDQSKLAAEKSLRKLAGSIKGAPALTVLRPALLYGPGCTEMGAGMVTLPAILRGVSRYLPGLSGGPRTNWCHVTDAAAAVRVVLENKEARGRTLNIADDTAISFGEALTSIIEAYGINIGPSLRLPRIALWAALSPLLDNDYAFERLRSFLLVLWSRVQKDHDLANFLRPRLNRHALFYVRDDAIIASNDLRALGWSPKWPDFRRGITETIRWYQEAGWAPRFDLEALAERRDADSSPRYFYGETLQGDFIGSETSGPFEMNIEVRWPSLPLPLTRREGHIEGELTIPGLANSAAIQGTIVSQGLPLLRVEYEGGFVDDEGNACRFQGVRNPHGQASIRTFFQLQGQVVDRFGQQLGEVRARSAGGLLQKWLSPDESGQ